MTTSDGGPGFDGREVEDDTYDSDVTSFLGDPRYRAPIGPPLRDFKPWHKPRKQYVRTYQWSDEIEELLQLRTNGETAIKYLGLPGSDFLDVRSIYQRFCENGPYSLYFLGFDESARPESRSRTAHNSSLQEIHGLPAVDRRSVVIGDDIRLLSQKKSVALEQVKRIGTFDVVNLDLCGHVGSDKPTLDRSMYNAVVQIFSIQGRRDQPWSFFLTTRVDQDGIDDDCLEKLTGRLAEFANGCDGFLDKMGGIFSLADFSASSFAGLNQLEFSRGVSLGLGSWLLGLATSTSSKLTIQSSTSYRIGNETDPNMLSLVFRVDPGSLITSDPTGLGNVQTEPSSECAQMKKMIQPVLRTVDLDKLLFEDSRLNDSLVVEAGDLLERARYDPLEYLEWCLSVDSQYRPT